MNLDYARLTDVINVQAVRRDYGRLLGTYRKLADAIATLEKEPPAELVGRVIQAADRWRSLDTDASGACMAAGGVLRTLGKKELAWEYFTTPLATKPNEAAPWVKLAKTLHGQGELALASRAYGSAFEAERTNAQILWDRAQVLQQLGRAGEAGKLYRQIAGGKWPRQFNGVQSQAKQRVGRQ